MDFRVVLQICKNGFYRIKNYQGDYMNVKLFSFTTQYRSKLFTEIEQPSVSASVAPEVK